VTIGGGVNSLVEVAMRCFRELCGEPESDGDVERFFAELPGRISGLEAENRSLMRLSTKFRREYAKLKTTKPKEGSIPAEKLKEAVEKLVRSHRRKKEKVGVLKTIVKRQHDALQRLLGDPTSGSVLALRTLIHQLSVCPERDRSALVAQSLQCLDSLHSNS
jgi:hypothetical protein